MESTGLLDDEPMAAMNLIPLIDIALTLLIIMMVTTAFVQQSTKKVQLPQTVTREGAKENTKDFIVTVDANNAIYYRGQKLAPAALKAALLQAQQTDKQTRVMVKADRTITYSKLLGVMRIITAAGLTHVVLPTDPKPGSTIPLGLTQPNGASPASP